MRTAGGGPIGYSAALVLIFLPGVPADQAHFLPEGPLDEADEAAGERRHYGECVAEQCESGLSLLQHRAQLQQYSPAVDGLGDIRQLLTQDTQEINDLLAAEELEPAAVAGAGFVDLRQGGFSADLPVQMTRAVGPAGAQKSSTLVPPASEAVQGSYEQRDVALAQGGSQAIAPETTPKPSSEVPILFIAGGIATLAVGICLLISLVFCLFTYFCGRQDEARGLRKAEEESEHPDELHEVWIAPKHEAAKQQKRAKEGR